MSSLRMCGIAPRQVTMASGSACDCMKNIKKATDSESEVLSQCPTS